jgi:hypothetical protein
MIALQSELEKLLLKDEPLPTSKKRGRKSGSKLKTLKNGERIIVTGRAAQAIIRREKLQKGQPSKAASKTKSKAKTISEAKVGSKKPRRGPGRPPKGIAGALANHVAKHRQRKKHSYKMRSGIIS